MVISTKVQLIILAVFLAVLLACGLIIKYQYDAAIELRERYELQAQVLHNNNLASLDSLRFYWNEENIKTAQKLGFIYDLSKQTDAYLKKQSYELKSMQNLIIELKSLYMKDSSNIIVKDSIVTLPFNFDTSIVAITGKSVINLKNLDKGFTDLTTLFKKIPLHLEISKNDKGLIMGTARSEIKEVEFVQLETTVSPDVYLSTPVSQKFLDKLSCGLMVGMSDFTFSKQTVWAYGLELRYSNLFGVWMLTDNVNNKYGITLSMPVSTLFKQ